MRLRVEAGGVAGLGASLSDARDGIRDSKAVEEAAAWLKNRIIERTGAGVDAEGMPFEPYSASYGKRRERLGKGSRVTLRFTGEMLDAMTASAQEGAGRIGFKTASAKAKAAYNRTGAGKRRIRRGFFAPGAADRVWIAKTIGAGVADVLKRAFKRGFLRG
ncbi:MAG: hypothetical protein HY894_07895 [Deltaproteobacteria bacterium]|nr:hypothetical protein [Deltaproteobacteria bacterium]